MTKTLDGVEAFLRGAISLLLSTWLWLVLGLGVAVYATWQFCFYLPLGRVTVAAVGRVEIGHAVAGGIALLLGVAAFVIGLRAQHSGHR